MSVAPVSRGEIFRELRAAYESSGRSGSGWYYVRVYPDGSVCHGWEPSPSYPESEYFGRAPHPVTVWTDRPGQAAGRDDGVFEWEPCDEDEADFWSDPTGDSTSDEQDERHTEPRRLGGLTGDAEASLWSDVMPLIEEKIGEFDWLEVVD